MRYVLHPGYITSKYDNGEHFIGGPHLCRLYGVSIRDCVFGDVPQYRELPCDVHLYPRRDGNYTLPPNTQIQRAQARIPEAKDPLTGYRHDEPERYGYARGWNDCREAMLAAAPQPPAARVTDAIARRMVAEYDAVLCGDPTATRTDGMRAALEAALAAQENPNG